MASNFFFLLALIAPAAAVSLVNAAKLVEGTSVITGKALAESADVKGLILEQPSPDTSSDEYVLEEDRHARSSKKQKLDRATIRPITCPYQGSIAIPHECRRFHICISAGADSTIGRCGENQIFHHQIRACLKLPVTKCRASMCKSATDAFRDGISKTNYLSCENMYPQVKDCKKNPPKTTAGKLVCQGLEPPKTADKSPEMEDYKDNEET